ncbi:MAG: 50S ribosomal protein L5 [Chloroflexi bacterium]|nr:50S ribosomal protein L5 [Chloroflexota bacterium]
MAENEATTPEGAEEETPKAAVKKRASRKTPAASGSRAKAGAKKPAAAKAKTVTAGQDDDGAEKAPAKKAPADKAPAEKSAADITSRQKTRLEQLYIDEVKATLERDFGYTNPMEIPKPTKIVLNIGVGGESIQALGRQNLDIVQKAQEDLTQITGQHAVVTKARKSIANFKLRDGMPVGVTVTLRGLKMWQFLDRLINTALPRVRDFHGVSRKSFDGRGNYALGLREQIIFPEIDYNRVDRMRGLQVNIITTAHNDEEARRLLELLGMPFTRVEDAVPVTT